MHNVYNVADFQCIRCAESIILLRFTQKTMINIWKSECASAKLVDVTHTNKHILVRFNRTLGCYEHLLIARIS